MKTFINKNKKDIIYLFPIIIFLTFCTLLISVKTDFKIYTQSSDFLFYHTYAENFFRDISTNFSQNIDVLKSNDYFKNEFIPAPFYPIFALLPLTIFGSNTLFIFQGYILTILNLILTFKLVKKINYENNLNINLRIFYIYFYLLSKFIQDSLTSSTMSVAILFVLLGFNTKNLLLRNILFCFSSLIRANFIVFIFSYALVIQLFKEQDYKKKLVFLLLPFITYLYTYFTSYINYPGSVLTYIFNTAGIQYNDWKIYGSELLNQKFLIKDIYNWNPNLVEIFNSFTKDIEMMSFVIHNYLLKISTLIGVQFDGLWQVKYDFWMARLYKSFYFVFFSLPGFLI